MRKPTKPKQPKPQQPKVEPPGFETPFFGPPGFELPGFELPKFELPKFQQPKPDQPEPDQPEPDQPEPDQPEPDQPKPDQPKPDQAKPAQPAQPKPYQPKPDQPKPDQPIKPALTPLQATLLMARRGNQQILPRLRETLAAHPEIWQQYGDSTRMLEQAWILQLSGPNLLISESLRIAVDQLRFELTGPDPSPLEKLLAGRAVASWLAAQVADITMAFVKEEGHKTTAVRISNCDAANRRFLAAAKCLAQVRRLMAGISIRVEHTVKPPAQPSDSGPVADRLRGLVDEPETVRAEGEGVLAGIAT